jgi:predicted nucleic-acid-binding Zn-ribbon protein
MGIFQRSPVQKIYFTSFAEDELVKKYFEPESVQELDFIAFHGFNQCLKISNVLDVQENLNKRRLFSLGEFVRANREKSNLIGWRQTLTTSPANHIRFLLVRANKFAKWKTGLNCTYKAFYCTISISEYPILCADEMV